MYMAVIVSSALNVVQAVRVKTQTLCSVTGHLHTFPWIWIISHDVEIRFKSLRAFYASYALRVVLSMSICVYVKELGGIYL